MKAILLALFLTGCAINTHNPIETLDHTYKGAGAFGTIDPEPANYWYIGSNKWVAGDWHHNGREWLLAYVNFDLSWMLAYAQ